VRRGYAPGVRLRDPWNAALAVTCARILVIPGLMVLLLVPIDGGRWWAAGLYLTAAATDSVDGWLARSRGQVTVAGAFLDPLADKLLVSAALVALIEVGEMPAWAAMVIIAREFAVTGLRLVAASEDLIIPASRFGKAKTLSQNAAITVIIAPDPWGWLETPLLYIAVVLTVLSGAYYFLIAQRRLFADKRPQPDIAGDP
jgi:CDP-diacylglycerol---glycerol-3-phosphate 3-phosphatidyltransferase